MFYLQCANFRKKQEGMQRNKVSNTKSKSDNKFGEEKLLISIAIIQSKVINEAHM